MMNLIFDTNILVYIVRAIDIDAILQFLNPRNNSIFISVVSEAEVKSLALQNRWGINRQDVLNHFLNQVAILDVNQINVNIYTQIDAYSQMKNPDFLNYSFETPRNMGKNDLWIASLAALLSLQLVTTDSDFDHLDGIFFDVRKIDPREFLPFFLK
jgi:tRNA(fMet)-specific endonuclease VapC